MNRPLLGRRASVSPGAALRSVLLRMLAYTCPRRQVRGFQLVDLCASGSLELFARKVSEALELIETHDPVRFARIRRDLKRFALIAGGGEFYHHGLNAYVMDVGSMKTRSVSELAATIVHEATHARLVRAGFSATDSDRERIEHICTEAEAGFAEKLPNDALGSRRRDQLRASVVPRWLIDVYRKLFQPDHHSKGSMSK